MSKTIIILPDGREIASGPETVNAVKSVTFTECVNTGRELTLGSVCANSVEIKLITPAGGLAVNAGDELRVYTVDHGVRRQAGIFIAEKPTRPSPNALHITAYDRIIRLDKDLTGWLESLTGWPYRVLDFARMVATQCGLTLKNEELLNGDYLIQKFKANGITGRRLMEWVGQICAKFCRATPEGDIEFAWYTNKFSLNIAPADFAVPGSGYGAGFDAGTLAITAQRLSATHDGAGNVTVSGLAVVSDDGNGNLTLAVDDGARTGFSYAMGSLSYEDYEVTPIQRVQLHLTDSDAGVTYPALPEGHTYPITGNFLLTNHEPQALEAVAKGIFEAVRHIRYTPCKVTVFDGSHLTAGDIVSVTDTNGKTFTTYIMEHTRQGQRHVFTSAGSHRRDSAEAVKVEVLSGKMLEVQKRIDSLKVLASQLETTLTEVSKQTTAVELTAESLTTQVKALTTTQTQQGQALEDSKEKTQEALTEFRQEAEKIALRVQSVEDNGIKKVETEMGYTFDDKGLTIQRDGVSIKNTLDKDGMEVSREGEIMLRADKDGVIATDVKVRNFLIVGDHARFENYSNGSDTKRTACFYIEEEEENGN